MRLCLCPSVCDLQRQRPPANSHCIAGLPRYKSIAGLPPTHIPEMDAVERDVNDALAYIRRHTAAEVLFDPSELRQRMTLVRIEHGAEGLRLTALHLVGHEPGLLPSCPPADAKACPPARLASAAETRPGSNWGARLRRSTPPGHVIDLVPSSPEAARDPSEGMNHVDAFRRWPEVSLQVYLMGTPVPDPQTVDIDIAEAANQLRDRGWLHGDREADLARCRLLHGRAALRDYLSHLLAHDGLSEASSLSSEDSCASESSR